MFSAVYLKSKGNTSKQGQYQGPKVCNIKRDVDVIMLRLQSMAGSAPFRLTFEVRTAKQPGLKRQARVASFRINDTQNHWGFS